MASHVLPTYARVDLAFDRGEGAWLTATNGDRYLDFASGVAVNALGHAHPRLVKALTEQAEKLWHTSNLYRVAGQERLAERLTAVTFADKVFFCNSGAEACEAAIKAARRYHYVSGHPERWRMVTFDGSFHGRTLATIDDAWVRPRVPGYIPFQSAASATLRRSLLEGRRAADAIADLDRAFDALARERSTA